MRKTLIPAAAMLLALASLPASAEPSVKCHLKFTVSGWSFFYKESKGTGTISCSNGQSMGVTIRTVGGGLTVGKSTIDNGHGEFSAVSNISELLGSYASGEAHAGAVKSSHAEVVTKGEVSLALSGTGRGWDLGVAFGKFEIRRR